MKDTQLSDEQMDHSEVTVETGGLHGKIELEDFHGVRVDVELNMKETEAHRKSIEIRICDLGAGGTEMKLPEHKAQGGNSQLSISKWKILSDNIYKIMRLNTDRLESYLQHEHHKKLKPHYTKYHK